MTTPVAIALWAVLGGVVSLAMSIYAAGRSVTSDGERYLEASRGESVVPPFHLRWLLPSLLPDKIGVWQAVTAPLLVLTCPLIALSLRHLGPAHAIGAAWIWASLSLYRVCARCPVLVDAPAIALGLAAVLSVGRPWWILGVLGVASGLISERAPIFAALWSHTPWPLLGLGSVAAIASLVSHETPELGHGPSLAKGRRFHGQDVDNIGTMVLPWGALLIAAVAPWGVIDLVCVALAYGQMLIAADRVRLYQWAAPTVLRVAMPLIPRAWIPAAVMATWFNPWGRVRF